MFHRQLPECGELRSESCIPAIPGDKAIMVVSSFLRVLALSALCSPILCAIAQPPMAVAAEPPRIVQQAGHFALEVDGHPYLILGGQVHNSSAWPNELPQIWQSLTGLHANTVTAPIYWEQVEAQRGHFDFSSVDQIVKGAREHNLHVILLWFGTWKNGNMHYAPAWVKADSKQFPRVIRPDGEPIDVLSPLSQNTLEADKTAFVALMRHLKELDSDQHTVLMVQVENESGNVGSIRDCSAEANRLFGGQVPADLLAAAHRKPGTWTEVFGGEADETFQAYYQAHYINTIAAAGKAIFSIPLYINVWVTYPSAQLPQRQIDAPGVGYPSGGAVQKLVGLWRALAPSIDVIAPDLYSSDSHFYQSVLHTYARTDNPLLVAETGRSDDYGKYIFYALGDGAIGFMPFGVDQNGWNLLGDAPWKAHAEAFALLSPINRQVAQSAFEGKLKTAVEERGAANQEVDFGDWQASVAFGFPQSDGRDAPGTSDHHGTALIARLGPDEFLITGIDTSIVFHLPGKLPWMRSDIVSAEEGSYVNGAWKATKLLNGDETDRGLQFHRTPVYVRIKMERF